MMRTDSGIAVVPGGGKDVFGWADIGAGDIGGTGPNPGLMLVLGALIGGPEAGRGMGALLKSSRGGTKVGRGALIGFTGAAFLAALATSVRSASNSRRCWRSYIMEDRTCSMRAEVISSVTRRLCRIRARCKLSEMPCARRARTCSYLFACVAHQSLVVQV